LFSNKKLIIMKNYQIFIFALLLFFSTTSISQNSELPIVNKKIIELLEKSKGKKIERGECWDLAEYVLDNSGAKWVKPYEFGRKINPKTEAILPGDIIQFDKVQIKIINGNSIQTENYQKHTAVIYEVKSNQILKIAQQNTSYGGKKVTIDDLFLGNIVKGSYTLYRPIKEN
jgi:hypothetical protein